MTTIGIRKRHRLLLVPPLVVGAAVLGVVLAPEGRLRCAEPDLTERSPDGRQVLKRNERPLFLAMPGGVSKARMRFGGRRLSGSVLEEHAEPGVPEAVIANGLRGIRRSRPLAQRSTRLAMTNVSAWPC